MRSDRKIWENFKSGDKSALSYIYFQNFECMFQYGMKFKDDPDFVKDCIQDVFFKLIEAGTKLGSTNNIRFYLFKALKNHIIRELTRVKKNESLENCTVNFHSSFIVEEQNADNMLVLNKEKALVQALGKLSERQREIIYLRYECGMNYEGICKIMNLRNDSARKLMFRAVTSLKTIIESEVRSTASVLYCLFLRLKRVL